MAEYQAKDGQVDRHGEMTGAITVNMILTMLPVAAWSFFIGPWLAGDRLGLIVALAVGMALLLPVLFLKPSRAIWAWLSAWAGRW